MSRVKKVADLSDGGNGDTILANAAIVMLLKQKAETIDVAAERFRLTADERQFLLAADKGEGLLLVRGSRTPVQIVSSRAEYRLATTSPRDLEQLAAERSRASESSALSSSSPLEGPSTMAKAMARSFALDGIRVNTVAPGSIRRKNRTRASL